MVRNYKLSIEVKMSHLLPTALQDSGIEPAVRYTLDEVAAILGCTLDHVRYLVTRKKLPVLKVGRQTWGTVRHDDLAAFLASVNGEAAHV